MINKAYNSNKRFKNF